ncbi:MAG: class II fructose-bisphosphate aldolase, partial [Verrucomicrobiales bacterium]|nr:class II fructose-bisphosphate aldolase [Verrucomicrobiales bacterium]
FALRERFALLAVNADSPAAITDVLEAARECDAPIIVETSLWQLNGRSFGAGDPFLGMARYLVQLAVLADSERFRHLPILFHTDHIKGPVTLPLLTAALRGLPTGIGDATVSPSTLSLDSSELSESDNIACALRLCEESARCGRPIALEMEAGVDDGVTPFDVTERVIAAVEAEAPGCLALWAPGVGTRHGLGEQTGFSAEAVARHRELAGSVAGRPVGIALHGSSGLPEEALRAAVGAGVTKVNWSSESLLVRSEAAREFYGSHAERLEKNHPQWKATAMDHGVQTYVAARYVPRVADRIRLLGGGGKASAFASLGNL